MRLLRQRLNLPADGPTLTITGEAVALKGWDDAPAATRHVAERFAGLVAESARRLSAARRMDRDGVGIVRVGRVAPQLERPPRLDGLRRHGLGVVLPGPRHAGHSDPARVELRRVAREEAAAIRIDHPVARQPDHAPVVGVPVLLLEAHVHNRRRAFHARQGTTPVRVAPP